MNIINQKQSKENKQTPTQPKYQNNLIKHLMKPKKKNPVVIDSDDESHYDQKIGNFIESNHV